MQIGPLHFSNSFGLSRGLWRGWALALAAALIWLLPAAPAHAQISCNATVNPLAFPTNMDVLPGAAFDSGSTISTSCTGITGSTRVLLCFALTSGTYGTSGGWQQMGSGANRLRFNGYTNSTRTTVWGTATSAMVRATMTASAPSATTPYYGRVAGAQTTAVPGAYSTTMTVTASGTTYTGTTAPTCPTASLSTFTFGVTGTVVSSCLVTATNMTFPNTSIFNANVDATSTVGVTCTNTTPYYVRLSGGNSGATDPTQRKMSLGGVSTITYGLYRDALRTLGWGSTDGVNTSNGTGTASAISHTVHGRIPPQTSPAPGTYTDTIVVTVSFL